MIRESEDLYAISSLLFGNVEGTVATTQDLKPCRVGGEQCGYSEAGGDANLLALMFDGKPCKTTAEIFGDLGCAGVSYAGKNRNELFAAQASHVIFSAEIVAKATRGVQQHFVTAVVAVFIVDGFEVVQIEHDEGQGGVVVAGTTDSLCADLLQRPSVEQTSERVGLGLCLELMLKLRHRKPDNAEGGHDGDKDWGEKSEGAGGC